MIRYSPHVDLSKETEISHESDSSSDHEVEDLGKFKCILCTESFFSESNLMTGMSAELSLVQDGANTVNPEKIQGATMPYG